MTPLFSIIVPVYNVAAELERAVNSVIGQTFKEWELILVDDGSTDGSSAICDMLAASDDRIKVVHKVNEGVVSARQRGFKESTGNWIQFLDGDDQLSLDCLEGVANVAAEAKVEMVQFGHQVVGLDGVVHDHYPRCTGIRSFDWVLQNSGKSPLEFLGMCIGDKCYRRDLVEKVFNEIGDVRISHSEDGLFAFAAFLRVNDMYLINRCYYRYILRQGSAVHKINLNIVKDKQLFMDRIELLARQSGRIKESQIRRIVEFHVYQACCSIFMMLYRNKANKNDVSTVLGALNRSGFLRLENREWNSYKRRLMKFLLKHQALCAIALRMRFFI